MTKAETKSEDGPRLPQWALALAVTVVSLGGSAFATLTLTASEASANAQRIDLLEAKIENLSTENASRARESAVLLERMDSFQVLLVEVRSDVRELVRADR